MGIKKFFHSTLQHFSKHKVSIVAQNNIINGNICEILDKLKKFNMTVKTPKSRINLVYNYGEYVDLVISFACKEGNCMILSKGLSKFLQCSKIEINEWQQLTYTEVDYIKAFSRKSECPVFIVETNEQAHQRFNNMLALLNSWSSVNYPLVIGIDIFDYAIQDIPAIRMLSSVLDNEALRFVFYNQGIRNIDYLEIPSQHNATEYPTGFFEGASKYERYINTMIDLRNLLEKADAENAKIYKGILKNICEDVSNRTIGAVKKKDMNIFDNVMKKFLFKTDTLYRMGYSLEEGGKYVEFVEKENKFKTTEKYILVTRDTELMLDGELISKINKIHINKPRFPQISWIEGVPGCGKSTYIIRKHSPGKDLVLTQTRASIKDIRDSVSAKYASQNIPIQLRMDYRTVASYIINNPGKKYEKVYIDEGLMMHAGYIGFIAELSGAVEIIVVGDSNQIPYIERSPVVTKWNKISDFCEPEEYITVTKRCPVDVCFVLQSFYQGISTKNARVRSILPTFKNGETHQLKEDTLILTFTQKEKKVLRDCMKKYKSQRINTIHEAQGLTSKDVVLVRIDTKDNRIYNSVSHAIVAISRHTESFRYLTTGYNDAVQDIIDRVNGRTDEELLVWNNKNLEIESNTKNYKIDE